MKKLNPKGFGVIEFVIVLVVVLLVGVMSYMVYKDHHKTTTTNNIATTSSNRSATTNTTQTKTSTPSQSTTTSTTATIKVPELGVEFTVPSAFSDITYHYSVNDPSGNQPISGEIFADLSTTKLDNLGPRCVASTVSDTAQGLALGMLVRGTGQGQAGEDFIILKQFNGYFIGFALPQDGCTASSQYESDTSGFIKDMQDSTITAIN